MGIEIAEDLLTEILKRLPIKSIGRFRSVCKAWNSLLSSPLFISIHHNNFIHQRSYLLMNDRGGDPVLHQCTLYHPPGVGGIGERVTYLDLPYDLNPTSSYFEWVCFRVVDVIHGVICLSTGLDFVLWNPAIRKSIPGCIYSDNYDHGSVAFGFDAPNNDFKVLKLSATRGWWYDIVSVRQGFWRREALPDTIYSLLYHSILSNACFANGNIYWMVNNQEGNPWALLLFDCEREKFHVMELPPEFTNPMDPHHRLWNWIFKHGDSLAVITNSWCDCTPTKPLSFEVWVMEDSLRSWKKLSKHSASYMGLMGSSEKMFKPHYRQLLFSDDLPIRLGTSQQPLRSAVYRESLFLMDMDVSAHNLPTTTDLPPLGCQHCYCSILYHSGNASTLQSKLL